MAKKDIPTNVNNNTNIVNVNIPHSKPQNEGKNKKPNWILKAIVIAAIGLACSIILIFVKNSTAANGKPAYIQGGPVENSSNTK